MFSLTMETVLRDPSYNQTMPESELTKEEIREMSKKELRKSFPSGWMKLTRYETNVLVVDTLLQEPPKREFTVGELAEKSGASERSIRDRIDDLVELDILIELPNRGTTRYQMNQYSPIVQDLRELNTTIERVDEGLLSSSTTPPSEYDDEPQGNIVTNSHSNSDRLDMTPEI